MAVRYKYYSFEQRRVTTQREQPNMYSHSSRTLRILLNPTQARDCSRKVTLPRKLGTSLRANYVIDAPTPAWPSPNLPSTFRRKSFLNFPHNCYAIAMKITIWSSTLCSVWPAFSKFGAPRLVVVATLYCCGGGGGE